jgi:hypothetical protein
MRGITQELYFRAATAENIVEFAGATAQPLAMM